MECLVQLITQLQKHSSVSSTPLQPTVITSTTSTVTPTAGKINLNLNYGHYANWKKTANTVTSLWEEIHQIQEKFAHILGSILSSCLQDHPDSVSNFRMVLESLVQLITQLQQHASVSSTPFLQPIVGRLVSVFVTSK